MEKNNYIVSFNENGYRPVNKVMTFEQKLKDTAKAIKATYGLPLIIMFQEILAGRNEKHLKLIRCLYPEYELILPKGFNYVKHFKSIMVVTLIRKDALGSYKVEEHDTELPNRICHVKASLHGLETHVINIHVPQVQNFRYQADWYIAERKRLNSAEWDLLQGVLHKIKFENVIIGGDMQECRTAANLKKLEADGYIITGASGTKSVRNSFFNESCIDHIIVSPKAKAALGDGSKIMYDNTGVGKYSDHTLLCLCS